MPIGPETYMQPALQPVFDKLFSVAGYLISKLINVQLKGTLKQWKGQLRMIRALLVAAEQQQFHSNDVKSWLADLQDLAFDMEDVLEHFAIQVHEKELNNMDQDSVDSLSSAFNNMVTGISDSLSALFNPIINPDIQSQIDEITERLQEVQSQAKYLGLSTAHFIQQQTIQTEDLRNQRESSCLEFEPKIYGRNDKKQEIIAQLLKDDQSNEKNYGVIPIVGKGGVGKTTLPQYVYNDEQQLKDHFHFKAWVCVSDAFDLKRVTTAIFNEAATGQTVSDFSNLNEAQKMLKQQLMGKKFLIVLDDIWNDNYNDLDKLQIPFRYAAHGSKVIMTTRNEKIANLMIDESMNTTIKLEGLSDDDTWCLFQQHIFVDSDLAEMRDDIIKKCKGLPLAAKALGGLLKSTPKSDRKNILDNKTWREASNVLPVLRLSYNHLPSHLRRMFAYCSVFPKDYTFSEMEVVLLWMAQGFLPDDRPEDEGRLCFRELVLRSLFEVSHSSEGQFIMHDLIHDLAVSAANGLCYPIDTIDIPSDLKRTRHVFLTRNATTLRNQLPLTSKLRTFYCPKATEDFENLDFIQRFQYIRTLRLDLHRMEVLPEYVGHLKHLRFLRLESINTKELTNSMANLCNLQTLWLEGCYLLQKLPNIRFLGKLRHLKIGRYITSLKEMPMGIGELTNLQSLDQFVLRYGCGERIRDLKNLNHLQGELTISGLESVLKVEDAKEAQLDKKDGLDKLCLRWGNDNDDVDDDTRRDVLEQLKPPTSIKRLILVRYRGLRFPNWLRTPCFRKMVNISLEGCDKCEYLPALGQLPSLKNLSIEGMDGIKEIGAEFYGCQHPSFPALESLSFLHMRSWGKWVHSPADDRAFPFLKKLSIASCSSLKELSPHLPSLKRLKITQCKEELSVSLERLPLLEVLTVDGCRSIQFTNGCSSVVRAVSFELAHLTMLTISCCSTRLSLPGGLLLPAVEHVTFKDCKDLGSLPRQLHSYTSLKKLTISNCKTMEELAEEGLPINLEELEISEVVIKQLEPKLILHHLHNLRTLKLEDVPKLEDLCVPSSLCHLFIKKLNELKSISSSNTTISNLTSLEVYNCPSFLSLLPEGLLLPAVERLEFKNCENMERLPSQLQQYTSLKQLKIIDCPKMEEIPEGGLPINLEEITIKRVNIKKRVQELGVHHLHSLRSLHLNDVGMTPEDVSLPSSMSNLKIWASQNLKSISSNTSHVSNLSELWVYDCPEFESLVANFTSLSLVKIDKCPKFQFCEEGGLRLPSNLTHLKLNGRMNRDKPIQDWGLHLLSSLQSLKLKDLGIDMESINGSGFPNLQLPSSSLSELKIIGFQNFKTINCSTFPNLTTLWISKCPKFESFGDHGLPPQLRRVDIEECESLKPLLKIDPDGHIYIDGDRRKHSLL